MENKNNVWSTILRIVTILLFVFTLVLVCVDFFDTSRTYFSTEIIIAIGVALIIACMEVFDSFQIGTIISLKRENRQIEKENENLKIINTNLSNVMMSINNNISINNYANVSSASQDEISNEKKEENITNENNNCKSTAQIEYKTLEKYIQENNFLDSSVIKNAKMEIKTPFMNQNLFFDLYIKNGNHEEFVEIKYLVPSISKYQYIYQQLFLIDCYNRINNSNAVYVLVLQKDKIEANNTIARKNKEYLGRMKELFKDLIEKGKMKIVVM